MSRVEGGRFRRILPVIAAPVALSLAAGCEEPRAEAAFVKRPSITATAPETRTITEAPTVIAVFQPTSAIESPPLEPLEVPTATQIRKSLPQSLEPDFVFENALQTEKDIPSFVTISKEISLVLLVASLVTMKNMKVQQESVRNIWHFAPRKKIRERERISRFGSIFQTTCPTSWGRF